MNTTPLIPQVAMTETENLLHRFGQTLSKPWVSENDVMLITPDIGGAFRRYETLMQEIGSCSAKNINDRRQHNRARPDAGRKFASEGERDLNHKGHEISLENYVARIGYDGPLDGSPAALAGLQERHLHAVPYENLDLLRGIPLSLEIPGLYDKIVRRRRGGYCFELNALFGWLLRELGYNVTDYFARFWRDEPDLPPKRRHHVLKVEIAGEAYLCDVGVGGIVPRYPVRLIEGLVQQQQEETYRMERDPYFGWLLCELKHGEWSRIYSFTEEPQLPKDYIMASYWCENAPDSIFVKEPMASIRTSEGRNTIAGDEFRIFTSAGIQAFTPASDAEYNAALLRYFGIEMT